MYLTLRFREPHGIDDGRCGPEVRVKVGFVWFEGVDDLHIQFGPPSSANYQPPTNAGDYLAPHPDTKKMTPLYSLELRDKLSRGASVTRGYSALLKKHWPSPNL